MSLGSKLYKLSRFIPDITLEKDQTQFIIFAICQVVCPGLGLIVSSFFETQWRAKRKRLMNMGILQFLLGFLFGIGVLLSWFWILLTWQQDGWFKEIKIKARELDQMTRDVKSDAREVKRDVKKVKKVAEAVDSAV